MTATRGKFITIEGTEGVGKSTNIQYICDFLAAHHIEYIQTREPGGTPLAEEIRELLLALRDEDFDPTAELLAVFSARAQHLNSLILPALNSGKWVVCDRFTDATFAYQGAGRGLSMELIAELEQLVQGDLRPDHTILLDIDVQLGLERASQRAKFDRFENEKVEFFERVRVGYKTRVAQNPLRYSVINAGQSLVDVQRDLHSVLMGFLQQ